MLDKNHPIHEVVVDIKDHTNVEAVYYFPEDGNLKCDHAEEKNRTWMEGRCKDYAEAVHASLLRTNREIGVVVFNRFNWTHPFSPAN